jgi:DNA repair protein RecO (recombination protein O)
VSATERVDLESAFVLHGMAYRETSEILDLLSRSHGRISVIARGMRRPRSRLRSILQPFQPLTVSWSGRGNLFTLRAAEAAGNALALASTALMAGFYMNEIVIRFLHRGDAHPELFRVYQASLAALAGGHQPEAVLRRFEMALLAEVGFGLSLEREAGNDRPLDPARQYQYVIEEGPVPVDAETSDALHFTGSALLAIARGDFSDPEHLHTARRLLRAVLDHHLDGRPLRTRMVFSAMQR